MMVLTLNNLAEKYKCLPSEALTRGNTFDLYVLDVSTRWVNYQHEKADQGNSNSKPIPKLSQDQLKAMMARARSENEY